MKLEIGDKVKLFDCAEANTYPDIIFDVVSEPWELRHGREVVKISSPEKSFRGGFATNKLQKVS